MLRRLNRLFHFLSSTFSPTAVRSTLKIATVTAQPLLLRNRAERRAGHRLE